MNDLILLVHRLTDIGMTMASDLGAPDLIMAGVFYALAGLAVLGALGVVLGRNIVHSALCLTASFIGVGCLYIFLSADFMGAVQILVYGGAVAILIVMAIMLTRREDMAHSNPSRSIPHQLAAFVVSGMFLLVMAAVALMSPFQTAPVDLGDTVTGIADLMLTKYVLPFEIVAVLLLIAMIGAIILAKGVDES